MVEANDWVGARVVRQRVIQKSDVHVGRSLAPGPWYLGLKGEI